MKIPTILVLVTMEILPAHMLSHPGIIQQPGKDVDLVTETSLPHVNLELFDNWNIRHHFYQRRDLIAKTFILNCTAVGNPQPSYLWTKDTVMFNFKSLGGRVTQISGQGSLMFLRPRAEDAGQYQCFAENEHGTASSDTVFVRTVQCSRMQYRNTSVKAVMSRPHELKCGYSGLTDWPKPQFYWTTKSGVIPENRTSIDPNGNLWFSKTIPSDSKTYTCVARTYYQSIPVRSVELGFEKDYRGIEFPEPHPLYISQSTKVIKGQSVDLYCIVNYHTDYNVTWYTNSNYFKVNSSRVSTDVTGQILRIRPVHVSDNQNYTCRISFNGTYREFGPILLSVFEKPKFKVSPKSVNKLKGETAVIRCETSGIPKPHVAWYFNGQLLPDNITHPRCHNRGLYLEIEGLSTHESGNFACNASNEAGYVFKDIFLHVEESTNRTTTTLVTITVVLLIIVTIITAYLWIEKSKKVQRDLDSVSVEAAFIDNLEDPWQFPRRRLVLLDVIGAGNFGRVFLAEAKFEENVDGNTRQKVAVKTTQVSAPDCAHEDLLREFSIMKRLGKHDNVTQLLGACTERSPIFLIMELLSESLQQFLRKAQANKYYDLPTGASLQMTSQKLIGFALQIARGMKHVSSQGIIHRDLATRNVLLSSDLVCKIADFGLAREVNAEQIYVRQTEVPLPVRWMSPESLSAEETSVQSDVWSFGVLLWELTTLGATPYPGKRVEEVKLMVRNGKIMEKPKTCDFALYNIMRKCWQLEADHRPDFQRCTELLSALLLKNGDYIQLDDFPENEYYNISNGEGEIV